MQWNPIRHVRREFGSADRFSNGGSLHPSTEDSNERPEYKRSEVYSRSMRTRINFLSGCGHSVPAIRGAETARLNADFSRPAQITRRVHIRGFCHLGLGSIDNRQWQKICEREVRNRDDVREEDKGESPKIQLFSHSLHVL